MKYSLVNEATNQVVNIIELDESSKWEAPAGHFIKQSDTAGIGMFWDGENFINTDPASV